MALNRALARALMRTSRRHLAARLESCHTRFWHLRCSNGHDWALPYRPCNLRICSFEARLRQARAAKRWGPILAELQGPKHVVLAMRNVPLGDLRRGIRGLWACFRRLRRQPIWSLVKGAVVALEITFNERAQSWHPHLHAIVDAPYLPWEDLMAAWRRASGAGPGDSRTCWIGAADRWAVRELVKYVTKSASLARYPEALEEFLVAAKRLRMIRSYGSLYRLKAMLESCGCPDCGAVSERVGILQLHEVQWDTEGVLRPIRAP